MSNYIDAKQSRREVAKITGNIGVQYCQMKKMHAYNAVTFAIKEKSQWNDKWRETLQASNLRRVSFQGLVARRTLHVDLKT